MLLGIILLQAAVLCLIVYVSVGLRRLRVNSVDVGLKVEDCGKSIDQINRQLKDQAERRNSRRVAVLKDGNVHHHCEVGSTDYFEAYMTKGLSIQSPDGKVIHGKQ